MCNVCNVLVLSLLIVSEDSPDLRPGLWYIIHTNIEEV